MNLPRMRNIVLVGAMAMAAASARADSLSTGQIAKELNNESVIPLAGGVGTSLARDLLYAQSQASYASLESLNLSIDSVLKAITLYDWPGGPVMITSPSAEPLVWLQASIAIDPSLTVTLNPERLNFGEVAVETPEPGALVMLLAGVRLLLLWRRGERAS